MMRRPTSVPAARAALLAAASSGLSRVPVNFIVGGDPLDARVAQIIQAMAGEAGFDVKITVTEAATLLNRLTSGTYELALLIWSGREIGRAHV